jgi:hypothetical protein
MCTEEVWVVSHCFCGVLDQSSRVADPHWFNADPDPAFFLIADPDPAFFLISDPDPVVDLGFWWPKIYEFTGEKNQKILKIKDCNLQFG